MHCFWDQSSRAWITNFCWWSKFNCILKINYIGRNCMPQNLDKFLNYSQFRNSWKSLNMITCGQLDCPTTRIQKAAKLFSLSWERLIIRWQIIISGVTWFFSPQLRQKMWAWLKPHFWCNSEVRACMTRGSIGVFSELFEKGKAVSCEDCCC